MLIVPAGIREVGICPVRCFSVLAALLPAAIDLTAMSQVIQAAQEPSRYAFEQSIENATVLEPVSVETPIPADFSIFNSKAVLGFSLLVIILVTRLFGQKKKLPAGAKPLPKLPGKSIDKNHARHPLTIATRHSVDWSFLGHPNLRSRGSMALRRLPQVVRPNLRVAHVRSDSHLDRK